MKQTEKTETVTVEVIRAETNLSTVYRYLEEANAGADELERELSEFIDNRKARAWADYEVKQFEELRYQLALVEELVTAARQRHEELASRRQGAVAIVAIGPQGGKIYGW